MNIETIEGVSGVMMSMAIDLDRAVIKVAEGVYAVVVRVSDESPWTWLANFATLAEASRPR